MSIFGFEKKYIINPELYFLNIKNTNAILIVLYNIIY